MDKVSKINVGDNLSEAIKQAVDKLGGISNFISQGDVVLIKPNFNTADAPPASTDIPFLEEIIKLVYSAGAKIVIVGDSSTMTMNSRKVMERAGAFDLLKMDPGPRVLVFDEGMWEKKNVEGKYLKSVSIPEILERIDKLILVPCLKTHKYAQFTGALKLSVGFMKTSQRPRLHLSRLQEKIAELNMLIKPHLIIMDGRKCFINEGPSHGEVREPGIVLASTDRIAIDIEGIKIIQEFEGNSLSKIKPEELPQIKLAKELLK